jgi:hypothetical protein
MRRLLKATGIFFGALFGSMIAFGGGMPTVPSVPAFSDPAAIVSTLNTLMATLQGAGTGMNNNTPVNYSLGSFCTATGTTPQTCNAQRGLVTTGTLTTAGATNAAFVINDSLVTAASVCQVTLASYSGAIVANGYPVPITAVTAAGTITVNLTNTHATNALSGTVGLAFNCTN